MRKSKLFSNSKEELVERLKLPKDVCLGALRVTITGNNEIWIDVYPLTRFLAKHTQETVKVEGTKEWVRTLGIVDPAVEQKKAENLEK